MSSPQNTTILGCFCCAYTMHVTSENAIPASKRFIITPCSFFEPENPLPVTLHADHDPVVRHRCIQRLVQLAYVRLAVVRRLTRAVVVVHDEPEPPGLAGRSRLQHLQVAIRISE